MLKEVDLRGMEFQVREREVGGGRGQTREIMSKMLAGRWLHQLDGRFGANRPKGFCTGLAGIAGSRRIADPRARAK